MASTHSQAHPRTDSGNQLLLEHPEAARHRMPRQPRSGGPLIGVTAMTAALGATAFAASPAAAAPQPPAVAAADSADQAGQQHLLSADPGLALAARIQLQADGQRTAADESARLAAAQEAEAKRAAQEAEAKHAEQRSAFAAPTTNYELTAHYGQSGSYWSHLHTGLDFAAATGTPVTAVGAGTVTSAGWSGAYGYRVIETLTDGTEIWYCHLSSIATASGEVAPGTVLGKVGATGNVTGPHLHLEVRPDGAAPVDPLD
ncbi:M23 family metallopeptidase, partial [Kitasatospora sp. Root187]|uniref:M23 family metallopeptidase n=2 Tax=unclassified Kitasatospora TaxID=2633591 RepID=UPI001F32A5D0